MGLFRTRALDGLDTLYRFAGGRGAPEEVDVEAPVGLVHDVSRMAQLERGFFFLRGAPTQTVSAPSTVGRDSVTRPTLMATAAVTTRLQQLGLPESGVGIWLIGQNADVTAGLSSLTLAGAGLELGGLDHNNNTGPHLTFAGNTSLFSTPIVSGGDLPLSWDPGAGGDRNVGAYNPFPFPIRLPPGRGDPTEQHFLVVTDGAVDVTVRWANYYWVGPRGVDPPRYR